ncbi:hypothetical protein [Kribbella sp. NPDC048928]|uniref:hypothetical protein n=1 Tax=Kribbella sp. NPDC048928 TaxID=3364111 RepID=UPI00371662C3
MRVSSIEAELSHGQLLRLRSAREQPRTLVQAWESQLQMARTQTRSLVEQVRQM